MSNDNGKLVIEGRICTLMIVVQTDELQTTIKCIAVYIHYPPEYIYITVQMDPRLFCQREIYAWVELISNSHRDLIDWFIRLKDYTTKS